MYTKAISNANPGAGDKPIDGSPWPFVYRNGTVGPMWTANLESSPTRLTAAQLAIIANSQDPYSIGKSGNVVCTVNGTQIKDDGVAGYYARRRNVPCANISVVSVPVVQTTTQPILVSSILPAVNALSSNIQAIAIAWVQPSMVGFISNPQSISAAIANGGLVTGTGCSDGSTLLGQGPVNPYFNSSSHAPFTDHHIRPAMMLVGEICPTCTATNNYSYKWQADFPAAKAVIDAAIAATDSNPSGGNVYWSLTGDLKRSQTTVLVSPLELNNGLSPYANAQILGTRAVPTSSTVSAKNVLLYEESAANWNYASPTFLPGAGIGYAVTSNSGWLPSDGNQTTAASWLAQGAVGAFGNAAEPCELLTYKHLDPALVIPNYTQGQTLVESLWKSVRLPWGGNFIGDPLAAPFTLQGGPAGSAPILASLNPTSAIAGTAIPVTLTGLNFKSPAAIAVSGGGVTASNVNVVSATSITATFTTPANAAPGTYNTTVTTASGVSGPVSFRVTSPSPAAPTLAPISPSGGAQGTTLPVTLTGTNFMPGATLNLGSSITATNVVITATRITASLAISSSAAAGARNVSVTTTAGTSNTVPFTVSSVPSGPVLSSISTASAIAGTVVNVSLTGSNFSSGATVTVGGSGVTVSGVSVAGPTKINATFTVASSATTGVHNVSVTTVAGTSNPVSFTVNPATSAPTLTSMTPNNGVAGTSVNLILSGTNFTSTTGVRLAGIGAAVRNLSVVSSTQINVTFVLAATTAVGPHNVYVTNSSGSSVILPFTVR